MPPCAIEFSARFTALAKKLPAGRRRELEAVLARLAGAFGQPHVHAGLGIRRLRGAYFECRLGQDTRLVLKLEGASLLLVFLGNHNEVQRLLKNEL